MQSRAVTFKVLFGSDSDDEPLKTSERIHKELRFMESSDSNEQYLPEGSDVSSSDESNSSSHNTAERHNRADRHNRAERERSSQRGQKRKAPTSSKKDKKV